MQPGDRLLRQLQPAVVRANGPDLRGDTDSGVGLSSPMVGVRPVTESSNSDPTRPIHPRPQRPTTTIARHLNRNIVMTTMIRLRRIRKENHGAFCGPVPTENPTRRIGRYPDFAAGYQRSNRSGGRGRCTRKLGKTESRAFRPNAKVTTTRGETTTTRMASPLLRRRDLPPQFNNSNCRTSVTMRRTIFGSSARMPETSWNTPRKLPEFARKTMSKPWHRKP
mmetsp:Transcript_10697/g.25742  ORF Transcript_10697/g.25742 Transcript_10697/m.25742 type:complete len:222 (-) Transcript_10697:500-1165(-)